MSYHINSINFSFHEYINVFSTKINLTRMGQMIEGYYMKEIIINNLNSVISFVAIIASFTAIIYSRSNLKTKKYIETITVQRISWIDSLRVDLSDVISGIHMLSFCDTQIKAFDEFVEHVGFEDSVSQKDGYMYRNGLKILQGKLDSELNKIDLIKKIDLSILKLNQRDDYLLIDQLEQTKEFVLRGNYESCINDDFIKHLKYKITTVLKKEWEKVKLEVRKGSFVNESKRANNFWF